MFRKALERCSHCGRSYTRSQWVKFFSWCPTCQRYICHECLGPRSHCPECGSRTSKLIEGLSGVSLLGGAIFIGIFSLLSPIAFLDGENLFSYFLMAFIFIGPLLIGFLMTYPITKTRRNKHRDFVNNLPKGIIPKEKRNTSGLSQLVRKYQEAGGLFPRGVGEGLKCYWMTPVMSKEEYMEHQKMFRRKLNIISGVLAFIGVIGSTLLLCFWQEPIILTITGITAFFGILILILNLIGKNFDRRDRFRGTAAFWKKVGFKNTYTNIEIYLEENGIGFKKTVQSDTKNSRWTNPFYKYHINEDLRIETHYVEQKDGNVTGHLQIFYKDNSYDLAKRIQDGLDEIFWKKDLLNSRLSMVRMKSR